MQYQVIYIMGVSGSGKSTIGQLLSTGTGYPFYDADDFHPKENIAKMKKQDNKTIQSCIHRLELTIKNIHNVLNEINDISIKYTTSYWKYFTNPYLYDKNGVYLIDKLKKYRIQLKDEFDMFYKILLLKDF